MIPHSRPWIGPAEVAAVADAAASPLLIGGTPGRRFKDELANLARLGDVHMFSSGRLALRAALEVLDLPRGSTVAVPTYACKAVGWSISSAGLNLALCDIDSVWKMSVDEVAYAVGRGCRAIILAPPFGLLQSAAPFRQFDLPIIHDLCQASPGTLAEAEPGQLGDIAVMSFHPTKYICASGGGVALDLAGSYSKRLAQSERALANIAPLVDMQSAMGLVQLGRMKEFAGRRRAIFNRYAQAVPKRHWLPLLQALDVPIDAMLRIPIRIKPGRLEEYLAQFADCGVIARRGVDNLLHREMGIADTQFPQACGAFDETLSVPFHPSLSEAEVEQVAEALAAILPSG